MCQSNVREVHLEPLEHMLLIEQYLFLGREVYTVRMTKLFTVV
jgi:hypothetical protein